MAQENQIFAASSHATSPHRGGAPDKVKVWSGPSGHDPVDAEGRSVAFIFAGIDMSFKEMRDFGMGADLYRREPVFRSVIDSCLGLLTPEEGRLLRLWLSPSPGESGQDIRPAPSIGHLPSATLPFLFSAQIALARLWMARDIHPVAMIGQGSGEYAAAHLAGVFSLPEAISILRAHGRFLETQLWDMPFPVQSTAFHAISSPFHLALASVRLRPPTRPFVSALTGDWITTEQATDPLYWAGHLHKPDRFSAGLAQVIATPDCVLLSIGPGRTLSELMTPHPGPVAHDRRPGISAGEKLSDKEPAKTYNVPPTAITPLFLIHDGSGSIAIYEALATLMMQDRPILGIEPKPDADGADQPTTIAQMAKAYIARMRTMQPGGPYLLAGLGAGGVIAFEMAQQLLTMGERTAFVGIIDGADVEAHERVFSLARLLFRVGVPVRRPTLARVGGFAHVWKKARLAHHPHGLFEGGDVVVFKTTCGNGAPDDRPAGMNYTDCLLGWGKRVAGEVRLVMVPGGHHSALQAPHVASLASSLSSALASALPAEKSAVLAIASPSVTLIRSRGPSLRPGMPVR